MQLAGSILTVQLRYFPLVVFIVSMHYARRLDKLKLRQQITLCGRGGAARTDARWNIGLAPAIPEDVPVLTALNRLEKAFVVLRDHQDSFQPHFVFGSLTKEQYALVQVIHFYNHLDEVRAV